MTYNIACINKQIFSPSRPPLAAREYTHVSSHVTRGRDYASVATRYRHIAQHRNACTSLSSRAVASSRQWSDPPPLAVPQEIAQLLTWLRRECGAKRIVLAGDSAGGGHSVACRIGPQATLHGQFGFLHPTRPDATWA